MKRLDNAIVTKINAYIRDNNVTGNIAEHLLSNLNQDGDYWWYLAQNDSDELTAEDRQMVENYIRDNYDYISKKIIVDLDNFVVYTQGYEHIEGYNTDPDLEIDMQEEVDAAALKEGLGIEYEVGTASWSEEDDCWAAKLTELHNTKDDGCDD